VKKNFYQPLPPITAPQWSTFTTVASDARVELTGGPVSAPARYRLTELSGALVIAGGTQATAVEIWVPGNMVGSIRLGPNVQAKIYVGGNVTLRDTQVVTGGNNGNGVGGGNATRNTETHAALENQTRRATNLQIYGIEPPTGQTRSMEIPLGRDLHAAVYAPGHDMTMTGSGHVMGSFAVKSLTATGSAKLHFDQALAGSGSPVIDYKVASWVEDIDFKIAR
jgi:hypothetical protein